MLTNEYIFSLCKKVTNFVKNEQTYSRTPYDYGILMQNVVVIDLINKNKPQNQRIGVLGSIVKIVDVLDNKTFSILFLKDDFCESCSSNKFSCEQSAIIPVNKHLWPYLASVSSPEDRLELALKPNLCEQFMQKRAQVQTPHVSDKVFGVEFDCPIVKGKVVPLCMRTEKDVAASCGTLRGIQGHHNSSYLDTTLFAMFTFTAVFDSLLFRPKGPDDIPCYEEVQQVLREEIVNPLRAKLFVSAERVMNLRKLLDQFSSVSGLTSEKKDPEEFLNSLLQVLKAKPFLKLSSGQETYHYQLFVKTYDCLMLPTVQHLFEQSFLTSDIKLKEVPLCLIIQMPRFGKNKMFPRILPSQVLDVTDIIENSPRQCTACGKLAQLECKECFGEFGKGLFCSRCMEIVHLHSRRSTHSPKKISVSQDFSIMADHSRLFMELFAVLCIETSHYVAFVKCGVGHEAPWCFFDSMADQIGDYNIPEMVACPDVRKWLSDEQSCRSLHKSAPSDRQLPEHARRLLCDPFICMYQSPGVMK